MLTAQFNLMQIGEYTILEQIAESEKSRLYLGKRSGSEHRYLLKGAFGKAGTEGRELALRNEAEIASLLHDAAVSEIFKADGETVFARSFFEGVTLSAWASQTQPSLGDKLAVAKAIAGQLSLLHRKKLLHQDLSPTNILVNVATGAVHLIDFDLSTRLDQKALYVSSTNKLEGTLRYMAPEQTGRMNRSVDYRADLYALGVILFELFCGQPPFNKEDPLEIIHEHLSRPAPHLHCTTYDLPSVLDLLVQKLLAKAAEDRYQSAASLEADLKRCETEWKATGTIAPFTVADLDKPLHFSIPEKLYGREAESASLLAAFEKAAAGKKALVTVAGYSGVGKSKLIADLHIPVTLRRGAFVSGKFDLLRRSTPYLAWVQVLQKWVEIILTEDRAALAGWKDRILAGMGSAAGVITRLVPEMEQVLGVQPLQEDLQASEESNRFNYALRQFFKAICTPSHPLVVALDDMQWADMASLHLLRVILTEPGLGHLLVITAYRDNEVSAAHPFRICLENTEADWQRMNETDTTNAYATDGTLIEKLRLLPLNLASVLQLISDTFKSAGTAQHRLAALVHHKTGGNAFFVHRFLETLYTDGFIALLEKEGQLEWQFRFNDIEALAVTDNVVDLMNRQIGRLPEATANLLETASCLGYQFELHLLAALAKLPVKETERLLFPALEGAYILPLEGSYKFVEGYAYPAGTQVGFKFAHDKIAQTFSERLSLSRRVQTHAGAFYLLYAAAREGNTQQIFELAGHLASAGNAIEDPGLCRHIYLSAGNAAKASSAFPLAYSYYEKAIAAAGETFWTEDYPKAMQLYIDAAESAYESGRHEEMERLVGIAETNCQTPFDFARIMEILMVAFFVQQRFGEAIETGIRAVKKLGFKASVKVGKLDVLRTFLWASWRTRKVTAESLLHMPDYKDEATLPLIRLLPGIMPSAFFVHTNLFVVIGLRVATMLLRGGISAQALPALANFAFTLCAIAGNVPRGVRFAQATAQLLQRPELTRYSIRTKFMLYFFVEQYHTNVHTAAGKLKQTFKDGLEAGDSDMTAFAGNGYISIALLTGMDLAEVALEVRRQLQYCIQVKNENSLAFINMYLQYVACLQGDAPDPALLEGVYFATARDLPPMLASNNTAALFGVHWYRANLLLFFNRCSEAVAELEALQPYKALQRGIPTGNYLPFLEALCRFGAWLQQPGTKPPVAVLKEGLKTMRKLARCCTDDFVHKVTFTEALLQAAKGHKTEAQTNFEKAIAQIDPSLNRMDKALCLMTYARYAAHIGLHDLARLKQRESAGLFSDIGATVVSDFLLKELGPAGGVLSGGERNNLPALNLNASNSVSHQGIDMFSVLKSTQVIASEVNLDALIQKLLPLMLENAGAEKGALLLAGTDGILRLRAAAAGSKVELLKSIALEDFPISQTVVNWVINTDTPVILDHAHLSGRFVGDPYITAGKVRSLLCLPIRHKSRLTGLLYLENNMVSGAFTQGRLEILNILATQAAVSIENASYFSQINALNASYERFVPQSFLEQLEKKSILNISLGDQVRKSMAVIFADIRGFTSISEQLPPEEVFTLLNGLWGLLSPVIDRHGGIIDKYIGDAVMALFPNDPVQAVKAAVEMQDVLSKFNALREAQGLFPLHMGIGASSGPMILGTVGSDTRMNTTVIGDTVNTAARLESLCKNLGARILMTDELARKVGAVGGLHLRRLGRLPLKGKASGVAIWEEYSSLESGLRIKIGAAAGLLEAVTAAVDAGEVAAANELLNQYAAKVPHDGAVNYFRERLPNS